MLRKIYFFIKKGQGVKIKKYRVHHKRNTEKRKKINMEREKYKWYATKWYRTKTYEGQNGEELWRLTRK
ncbi:unnamed protein product [Meloidogyne enterolobii]|uniref:Uncharacterized protein n=1 Tax=Meloidogyne enterolobii TaxID=390850 RepID=A0ACB1APK5_MELEN